MEKEEKDIRYGSVLFQEEIEWPIWTGPEEATDEELYAPDND